MPAELDATHPLEIVRQAVQICLPSIEYLPGGRTIQDILYSTTAGYVDILNVCVQPLTRKSRLLDFHRVRDIPYMDGEPTDDDIYVVCLLLSQSNAPIRWVMWHHQAADPSGGPRRVHNFTLLSEEELGQLLGAQSDSLSTLLHVILKKLTGAIRKSRKRSLERYNQSVIQDNDITSLVEKAGWDPTHF